MKRIIVLLLVLALFAGCGQQNEQPLMTLGAPNQILKELALGNAEGAMAPFGSDVQNEDLKKQLEEYAVLIDGRAPDHCDCVRYERSGSIPERNYEETTYFEITLEDGAVLYAICRHSETDDRIGLISFELFTECPW